MTKEIWINLPVKNVNKSKEFFSRIGFSLNEQQTNETMACFSVGEKQITVLFFDEATFKGFTSHEIADTQKGVEVLISFDAESREEIDETARKVSEAGGNVFAEPAEIQGWMYGFAFADLDGHRWNMLFMDFSKLP
ncbi:MAG TPA: VOC family protein [Pyrinomonadaceae bacterium]|nr:VOC family protein [Pyrinomonadaceae bacterium]